MSDDELLDLVNENDEITGTVWKSEVHRNPYLIHREVAIAVFNEKGEILLQQRSLKKENSPGEWKITAAKITRTTLTNPFDFIIHYVSF